MTDQPTPTPSLEEARKPSDPFWRPAPGECPNGCDDPAYAKRGMLCSYHSAWQDGYIAGEATTRAEVIREVEAALLAGRGVIGSDMEFLDVRPVLGLLARLRALSQGGEGKA